MYAQKKDKKAGYYPILIATKKTFRELKEMIKKHF